MKSLFLIFIKIYQLVVSPLTGPHCRYYPTCSAYAFEAVEKYGSYGSLKGGILAMKRILRCHPFHDGGYDPVP